MVEIPPLMKTYFGKLLHIFSLSFLSLSLSLSLSLPLSLHSQVQLDAEEAFKEWLEPRGYKCLYGSKTAADGTVLSQVRREEEGK